MDLEEAGWIDTMPAAEALAGARRQIDDESVHTSQWL